MAIIQVMMLTGAGAVTMAIGAGGAPSAKATRAAGDETRVATGYRPPVTGM